MHLADGTLANQICTITTVASAAALALVASRATAVREPVDRSKLTRAAVGAALVFGAQMVDVPLFGAVPVHLIGAAFLTLLAGPALALFSMTAIVVVQALALNDGGVSTLGANVFNMGVIAVAVAAASLNLTRSRLGGRAGLYVGAAFASAASVLVAVTAMALELSLSGASARDTFLVVMSAHAPFAAFETAATLLFVVVGARAFTTAGDRALTAQGGK
jgi:cobalt/nickel transport system permease protein